MLDSDTKDRINKCRDILVGKVPDPKSQVEQITFAMLYKFMNDLDARSEKLGGDIKYFNGEYAKYSWNSLLSPSISSFEMFGLYEAAIREMPKNQNIEPLFRDIFSNAYIPYRDEETLRLFLKEINGFTYDHSERLGDAFEYLLSVLGSQGGAGQFRTPRHIIEFMVEIIDPKKNESILDPACGTAGFLISAYNYILKKHHANGGIAPNEVKALQDNIKGYDISPDMVRLSLVNMYLHNIQEPHIDSYDTLTKDIKWDEKVDIILANPPFMSPKGGIRPHKRFSVQSNRSEVLFVDYIAEHLKSKGRAAVIVPDGIISQVGKSYKQLRKMLLEDCLVAVISLPSGVFNPYSAVKTSILIFDKVLVNKTDKILFAKIENDGYHLGAQRYKIDKSDIPEIANGIKKWLSDLHNGKEFDVEGISQLYEVSKEEIKKSGDFNLRGEKYVYKKIDSANYPMVKLGEVIDILNNQRRGIEKSKRISGPYPYYGATRIIDYVEGYIFDEDLVLVGQDGAKWGVGDRTAFAISGKSWVNEHAHILRPHRDKILDLYLIEILNGMDLSIYASGVTVQGLNQKYLRAIEIPLPPIEIQKEIVAEIESYQKIIDGSRMVVKNYKPKIPFNPKWAVEKIIKIAEINPKKAQINIDKNLNVSFVPMADMSQNEMLFKPKIAKPLIEVLNGYTYFQDGDVILARVTPCFENGKAGIAKGLKNGIGFGSSEFYVMRPNLEFVIPEWIYFNIVESNFLSAGKARMTGTSGLQRVPKDFLENWSIPCPPKKVQKEIVKEIGKEQKIIESNKEAITIFEDKIKTVIERIWSLQ